MKTQISRDSDRPKDRRSGVWQQMGRMITDADLNELVSVMIRRLDEALTDAVGSGSPKERGARVHQEPGDTDLVLVAGIVYADGVRGELCPGDAAPRAAEFAWGQQADFPAPSDPPGFNSRIYADLWDLVRDSHDVPQLRDPALHGADTCTRTQTQVQVKWCPSVIDPEDEARNPRIGDAGLTLTLRARRTDPDPCDPCADDVALAARTGNYLFRLEVHDVRGDPTSPERITLKWSSENGAERHAVASIPPDFEAGDWTYELHDDPSDRHLGIHFAAGFTPTRGQLVAEIPDTPPAGVRFVRRWDGYIELERSAGTWSAVVDEDGDVAGSDRGQALSAVVAAGSHGDVVVGSDLSIQLASADLDLTLDGSSFVAGDYWLVPVREAVHEPGDVLLDAGEPVGITHHYVTLGQLDPSGTLMDVEEVDPPRHRKLNFPPLTNLHATDVGFAADPDCEVLQPASNVKQALDLLCARTLGSGGGCAKSIGPGGDYATFADAVVDLAGRERDPCLCFLPGNHTLDAGIPVGEFHSIRLSGCGTAARISVERSPLDFMRMRSATLVDLALDIAPESALRFVENEQVRIEGCEIEGERRADPLMMIEGGEARMERSHITATPPESPPGRVKMPWLDLGTGEIQPVSFTAAEFDRQAESLAQNLSRMDVRERMRAVAGIRRALAAGSGIVFTAEQTRVWREVEALISSARVAAAAILDRLRPLRPSEVADTGGGDPAVALVLGRSRGSAALIDNRIVGVLSLHGDDPKAVPDAGILKPVRERLPDIIRAAQGRLELVRNRLDRVLCGAAMVRALESVASGRGSLEDEAYRWILARDNIWRAPGSWLAGGIVEVCGNHFEDSAWEGAETGLTVINGKAVYLGNTMSRFDDVRSIFNVGRRRVPSSGDPQHLNIAFIADI